MIIHMLCSAQVAVDDRGLDGDQADALAFLIHADALRLAAPASPGTALRPGGTLMPHTLRCARV